MRSIWRGESWLYHLEMSTPKNAVTVQKANKKLDVVRNSIRARQEAPCCLCIYGACTKWMLSAVLVSASQAGQRRVRDTKTIKVLEHLPDKKCKSSLDKGRLKEHVLGDLKTMKMVGKVSAELLSAKSCSIRWNALKLVEDLKQIQSLHDGD